MTFLLVTTVRRATSRYVNERELGSIELLKHCPSLNKIRSPPLALLVTIRGVRGRTKLRDVVVKLLGKSQTQDGISGGKTERRGVKMNCIEKSAVPTTLVSKKK